MSDVLRRPFGVVTASVLALTAWAGAANATLLQSYDFNGTLLDTLDPSRSLTSLGGTVTDGEYVFGRNEGLTLSNAFDNTSSYGIEIGLRFTDSVDGFNKVIDFQNLTSDQGLYVYNGRLDFYSSGITGGEVPLGTDVVLGLSRSGDDINLYVNRALVASGPDRGSAIPLDNFLTFFVDDTRVVGESFAGSTDFIRIHDGASSFGQTPGGIQPSPVPVPATLPLLLAGLGLLASTGRFLN